MTQKPKQVPPAVVKYTEAIIKATSNAHYEDGLSWAEIIGHLEIHQRIIMEWVEDQGGIPTLVGNKAASTQN